jgi:hypothetical protein
MAQVDSGKARATLKVGVAQMTSICRLVAGCSAGVVEQEPHTQGPSIPDALYSELVVTRDGHSCGMVANKDALAQVASQILHDGLQRAEDERWNKAGPFKLGRVWHVEEEVRDSKGIWTGEMWRGTWTPRPGTNMLDAIWIDNQSGQERRDTVILDVSERGRIAMHCLSSKVKYKGYYLPEHPERIQGLVGPKSNESWSVSILY